MNVEDWHVLMLVAGPGVRAQVHDDAVETTQVTPTVLSLLGLDPAALSAVRMEGTRVLPGVAGTGARRAH